MNPLVRFALFAVGVCAPLLLSAQFANKAQFAGVDLSYPQSIIAYSTTITDPYSVGGASCACDVDGDGWTDLIVTRPDAPCLVFINNRDGTFREEAHQRGLDIVSNIGGIAAGDLSNKGSVDIVMSPVSGPRYFLFINDGTGHFREAAVERGADSTVTQEPHRGQSISLVDYDRDGYLDIYTYEWQVPSTGENTSHSVLLHNKGRTSPGYYENKTAAAGLTQPVNYTLSSGYCGVWADLDGDGYPDLMLSADYGRSQMYWNNGDGTFTNATTASGLENSADAMGVALLDYDGDGRQDIFVTTIGLSNPGPTSGFVSANKLFRNMGGRHFVESATAAGVKESGWGWGTGVLDVQNKGWPDLVATNGYVATTNQFESAKTDYTKLFINQGNGTFTESGDRYGITDNSLGRSVSILDYDNDGRQDILITNTLGHRFLYHNESPAANAHWLALKFTGTASNRDGYGCEVTVTVGGRDQTAVYNPTNSYLGQHEPRLHFGLGASSVASRVKIKWPSGAVQELTNVSADQLLSVTEGVAQAAPPSITTDLNGVTAYKDDVATLSVSGQGFPAPVYVWYKDGVRIDGQNGPTLVLNRIQPIDAGVYTVNLINQHGTATSRAATVAVIADIESKSVARWWNEALLDSIRKDTPNPPVHARNLYHLSATLWDSFWAYERSGWTNRREIFVKETPALSADEAARLAAQRQAMSYAAYTVIKRRFANSPGRVATVAGIRWLMQQLGYDPDFADSSGSSPAAVGLRIGQAVLDINFSDGANETGGYRDATGYTPVNAPLAVRLSGTGTLANPDRWQPLDLVNTITQNGIVLGPSIQTFIGSNAINTRTFALRHAANNYLMNDPGPPPQFGGPTKAEYIQQAKEVIVYSSQLTASDGATIDISPGHLLNNPLGTNDGQGHATNPYTGRPYAGNVVPRGDYARVLAEFWADGPRSETPPGHWNVLFNQVSDNPLCTHQLRGLGRALPRLQWDVCGYLALNGAVHDAACAAWTLKRQYDSVRPITMIRHLASLGQSTDSTLPSYNSGGLPLVSGQIELITTQTAAAGQRHAHLADHVGEIAIKAWRGTPADRTQISGVGWILGKDWVPYQLNTFVTPAFPAYISGHSTFSRSAAEVLTRYTGSEYFPGGMATYDFPADTALGFEAGPSKPMQLQWATYYDAADQAGLSRLYGGIHIAADDFTGRRMGSRVGNDAFDLFLRYYDTTTGSPPSVTEQPAAQTANSGQAATFRTAATAGGAITYQWQRLAAGESVWSDLRDGGIYSGATTSTLSIASVTDAMSGDLYRAVITSSGTIATTQTAALSVTGTAVLEYPVGVAAASGGTLYVVDSSTNTVRSISATGQVATLAGTKGLSGSDDGTGSAARFNQPSAIAVDRGGTIYVADTGNALIRKITPAGVVTTLAGSSGHRGSQDGTGAGALLNGPAGLAIDRNGDLIVSDTLNNTIRRVTPEGVVTTIAGLAGRRGSADGSGSAARFNSPSGLAVDAAGNIFVADTFNDTIRQIDAQGRATTIAGFPGISGSFDGSVSDALLNQPSGLALDQSGNLLVADAANNTLRRISGSSVATLAGLAGVAGQKDGVGPASYFNQPKSVTVDSSGVVFVADSGNAAIRKITTDGTVSTLSLVESTGSAGGTGGTGGTTGGGATGSSPGGGGGGGGGAPSVVFFGLLLALGGARWLARIRSS